MATNNAFNTYIVPTTANEVTQPSQPAFLAYLGTKDLNVTGDETTYVLGEDHALTQVFDQNSDFDVGGSGGSGQATFTAPVTGRYKIDVILCAVSATGGTREFIKLVTSNRLYQSTSVPFVATAGSADNHRNLSILADMDAADTAHVEYQISGIAKIVDIDNAPATYFSGRLEV